MGTWTRKLSSLPTLVVLAGVVAGTGGVAAPGSTPRSQLLYVGGDAGITALDARAHRPVFRVPNAVASPGWSRLLATSIEGTVTVLRTVDTRTGSQTGERRLNGNWSVRVVSHDGRVAALLPAGSSGGPYQPAARLRTTIVLASTGTRPPRRLDLAGNYEPEAFTTDGTGLVVLQYSPPAAPQRYQVRLLDLRSGRVGELTNRAGGRQEIMRGVAYAQVLSPDGNRLSTLYVRAPGAGQQARAFVHVLDLRSKWAECVDLPARFSTGSPAALAASPDGRRLYVAVPDSHALAVVDMATLRVERTGSLAVASGPPGPTSASADTGGRMYVAHGSEVVVLDRHLSVLRRLTVANQLLGIRAVGDGRELLVAVPGGVTLVDSQVGTPIDSVAIPGTSSSTYLAPAVHPIHPDPPGGYPYPAKE